MTHKLLLSIIMLGLCSWLPAQNLVTGGDFESWTQGTGNFENPTDNFWTTLNQLSLLGPTGPVTVSKTTDAYAGTYAARLESGTFGTLLVPGLIACGRFNPLVPPYLFQGQPFTQKPERFTGYYKYFPVMGDSAAIYAEIHIYDVGGGGKSVIADASMVVYDTVDTYTYFDIPFEYYFPNTVPDSITIVLVSSAGGETFQGQAGSLLFVDEISIEAASTGIEQELAMGIELYPRPADKYLYLHLDKPQLGEMQLSLFNTAGQLVKESHTQDAETRVPVSDLSEGIYLYQLRQANGRLMSSGKIMIHHP